MMMPMFRVAIVCAAALGLAAKPASCEPLPYTLEDNVVVVHDRNFETVVSEHRTVLLEFYAPWCGHCKNLVPEYAAVGKFIHRGQEASGEFNMIVAKSDATANRNLAMAQSVSSYPTILLFQNGALVEKYSGERSFEDIMECVLFCTFHCEWWHIFFVKKCAPIGATPMASMHDAAMAVEC